MDWTEVDGKCEDEYERVVHTCMDGWIIIDGGYGSEERKGDMIIMKGYFHIFLTSYGVVFVQKPWNLLVNW